MNPPERWLRAGSLLTAAVLVVAYAVFLQSVRTGLPGLRYASNVALFPVGWPELSRSVERRKQALRASGSERVLIVGMDRDFIASEAAFYQMDQPRAVQETTGNHLFEGQSLMYAYWFPLREQDGAALLLVGFKRAELKAAPIRRRCESFGPIEEHLLRVNGSPVRFYYTRSVYNYRSGGVRRPK